MLTTQQIAELVSGDLVGPGDVEIEGLEQVDRAQAGQLTFIGAKAYIASWKSGEASAALVDRKLELEPDGGRALIRVDNADLAMSKVLEAYAPPLPSVEVGVHPTAIVDPSADLGEGVCIGAGCVIGKRVRIGDGTVLYPNVTIFDDSSLGRGCTIWSGTVIRERCEIGDDCILHTNVAIGSDGFGFRPAADGSGLVKVPQIGTVKIGNGVEIGASSCVDRGKFAATVIGDGCKIDNLVQIAHNCILGRCCIVAGHAALGGTAELGDGVIVGGKAAVKDHVKMGPGSKLAATSSAMNDVPAGEAWAGTPAQESRQTLREIIALRKLGKDSGGRKKRK